MKLAESPATRRAYDMTQRGESAERTRLAIVDAALSFIPQRMWEELTIEEIAMRAGVSVRTVLRRFGSKDGLVEAAAERARELVADQRRGDRPGDLDSSIAELVEHYERWGDNAMWLLDHRRSVPVLEQVAVDGTRLHEDWVRRVFAPQLAAHPARSALRRRLAAALGAVTDVHTWEMLRRRSGLSRDETETALRELCAGVLREGSR
jgi:AcrR family transcriptional regulator